MNIKKLFALLAGVSLVAQTVVPSAGVFGADYSQELQDAYDWAYSKWVTTMSSIDNANMYGAITRAQMAKMLSVYATEILGKKPNESATCEFTDIDSVKGDLHDYIIESCKLGLMGQNMPNNAFRPYETISRAQFGTALSRALWGDKYNGGTPYYAKHLEALKANGIMTQIDNPENRDEVRGYVMLMLMRSDEENAGIDCEDSAVKLACLDPELNAYKDCPPACRDNEEEEDNNTVVKSGDLAVTAEVNEGASVISNGATSELDTLTFKASEDVTLNSVTLERYGLSAADAIDSIWLEDVDGNKVTAEKSISTSKDTVTLSLKKDYKEIWTEASFIVVVKTANLASTALGTNIWFKVVDVDSSAKNLDKGNYKANLYNFIDYSGNGVSVDFKWATAATTKSYNYEEGKFYDVAKFRVTASKAAVAVDGFTLTNTKNLDLKQYADDVEILLDGNKISNVKSSFKNDSLTVSFDPQEIAINKNATYTVRIALNSDFNRFGDQVNFEFDETTDLSVKESKNDVRVKVTLTSAASLLTYTFNGWKVNLDNTKLSATIEAGQGSEGITVAKGKISVGGQVIRIENLTITPTITGDVTNIKLLINGEEYEATNANWWKVSKKIVIEEDADVEITVDLDNAAWLNDEIEFTVWNTKWLINRAALSGYVKYDDNGDTLTAIDGSISVSKLKVQKGKGSLSKDKTSVVEYKVKEASTSKTVFDWTFTAKKQNTHLNNVEIKLKTGTLAADDSVTFDVYVDNDKVATFDYPAGSASEDKDFADVIVDAGKSVAVKVDAKVYASAKTASDLKFDISLNGEDDNDNPLDASTAELQPMRFVDDEAVIVSTSTSVKQQDVVLTDENQVLAAFVVKPGNKADSASLSKVEIKLSGSGNNKLYTAINTAKWATPWTGVDADDYFEVKVGSTTVDTYFNASGNLVADDFDSIDSIEKAGTTVTVTYKKELAPDEYKLTVAKVNNATPDTEYTRKATNAIVRVISQEWDKASKTTYKFAIEYATNANEKVESLTFTYQNNIGATSWATKTWTNVQEGQSYTVDNNSDANYVQAIAYTVNNDAGSGVNTTLAIGAYEDFFKVDGTTTELQAYAKD